MMLRWRCHQPARCRSVSFQRACIEQQANQTLKTVLLPPPADLRLSASVGRLQLQSPGWLFPIHSALEKTGGFAMALPPHWLDATIEQALQTGDRTRRHRKTNWGVRTHAGSHPSWIGRKRPRQARPLPSPGDSRSNSRSGWSVSVPRHCLPRGWPTPPYTRLACGGGRWQEPTNGGYLISRDQPARQPLANFFVRRAFRKANPALRRRLPKPGTQLAPATHRCGRPCR